MTPRADAAAGRAAAGAAGDHRGPAHRDGHGDQPRHGGGVRRRRGPRACRSSPRSQSRLQDRADRGGRAGGAARAGRRRAARRRPAPAHAVGAGAEARDARLRRRVQVHRRNNLRPAAEPRRVEHLGRSRSRRSASRSRSIALPLGRLARPHAPRLVRRDQRSATSAARCRAWPCSRSAIGVPRPRASSTSMLALVVLAVPPIVTNAYLGVDEVDRDIVDAARGMGMSDRGRSSRGSSCRSPAADVRGHPHGGRVRGQRPRRSPRSPAAAASATSSPTRRATLLGACSARRSASPRWRCSSRRRSALLQRAVTPRGLRRPPRCPTRRRPTRARPPARGRPSGARRRVN